MTQSFYKVPGDRETGWIRHRHQASYCLPPSSCFLKHKWPCPPTGRMTGGISVCQDSGEYYFLQALKQEINTSLHAEPGKVHVTASDNIQLVDYAAGAPTCEKR